MQYVWAEQGIGVLKENCISGKIPADCGRVKAWLAELASKVDEIYAFSFAGLLFSSMPLGFAILLQLKRNN